MPNPKEPPLPPVQRTGDWLTLPGLTDQPLRMRQDWLAEFGPLPCTRCGRPIGADEQFRLAGYCAMGGLILAAQFALYADILEPHAEHLDCANPISDEPSP